MENTTVNFKKCLILILVAILGYWSINNLNVVVKLFNNILNIIFPFVLGGSLAFILNIPMTFFENKLTKNKKRKNKKRKNNKTLMLKQ